MVAAMAEPTQVDLSIHADARTAGRGHDRGMTGESAGVRRIVAQIALVWLTGSVAVAVAVPIGVLLIFVTGPFTVLAPVGVVAGLVLALRAVAAATAGVSWLPRTAWALLVALLGTAAFGFGLFLDLTLGWRLQSQPALWIPAAGVPFALAAGALVRRWPVALAAGLVAVATVVVGLQTAVRAVDDQAFDDLGVYERYAYVADAEPGYRRALTSVDEGTVYSLYEPTDGDAPWATADITLAAVPPGAAAPGDPGWHEVRERRGEADVVARAPETVGRDTLLDVVHRARPMTRDELREAVPHPHRPVPKWRRLLHGCGWASHPCTS
jgi:hypothetical protein